MRRFRPVVLAFLLIGCGKQDDTTPAAQAPDASQARTPYGSIEEVKRYLEQINPYIEEVSELQARVEQQVGSSGRATSRNLAGAMREVHPQLKVALKGFSRIAPPPLLAPFHTKIEKLMAVRLEAYTMAIEGFEKERGGGDQAWHAQVEQRLNQANGLISELNAQMYEVNEALRMASALPGGMASP